MRSELKPMLGDIEPVENPNVETFWTRSIRGVETEAMSLTVEDGIAVPLVLMRPPGNQPAPVVIGVARDGKERFFANRAKEIEALLKAGIAVCLPDVRATGETAPAPDRTDGGAYQRIAQLEFDLGTNLLGSRLKDLRTVLAYLKLRDRTSIHSGSRFGETPSRRQIRRTCGWTNWRTREGRRSSVAPSPWVHTWRCSLPSMTTVCAQSSREAAWRDTSRYLKARSPTFPSKTSFSVC